MRGFLTTSDTHVTVKASELLVFPFRCPSYGQIPASCHIEADPNDPCCRKPVCQYDPSTGQTYVPIPAFAPAVTGKGVVEPPTSSDLLNNTQYTATVALFQTGFTPVPPTVKSNITGGIGRLLVDLI